MPIQDLKVGDTVHSFDESIGRTTIGTVEKIFVFEGRTIGTMGLSSGQRFELTPEHPFYLPREKTWVEAKDLAIGSVLLAGLDESAKEVTVTSIKPDVLRTETVYNISVGPHPTFYVDDVLVHNKSCVPCEV